jgi:exopolysaccharide biosynthesis protein
MKVIITFFQKPYRYAICFAFVVLCFSVYVMLDVFVIEKVYAVLDNPTVEVVEDPETPDIIPVVSGPEITDMSYCDENIDLKIEKFDENGVVFYVADVKISGAEYLKTAMPGGVFGKNIIAKTSSMAKENKALFAVNGDYCTFKNNGVIMRNGQVLRVRPRRRERFGLVIDKNGDLLIIDDNELTEEYLDEIDAVQCFSFGPTLVVDGEININNTEISKDRNPRTAIGQIEPLHYIFIVADGRTKLSKGMKFPALAEEFIKRGCVTAYNLDGGGSSTMWFNGKVINSPNDGKYAGEREISDIIYIAGGIK